MLSPTFLILTTPGDKSVIRLAPIRLLLRDTQSRIPRERRKSLSPANARERQAKLNPQRVGSLLHRQQQFLRVGKQNIAASSNPPVLTSALASPRSISVLTHLCMGIIGVAVPSLASLRLPGYTASIACAYSAVCR